MRPVTRAKAPPLAEEVDAHVVQRWMSDECWYPVFHYYPDNLARAQDGQLHVLLASEKERILGYPHEHTLYIWRASRRKTYPADLEAARSTLLGL